jgi:hypothetical protein
MNLITCPRYSGLRLMPQRCAQMYRDATTNRGAVQTLGFTRYVNGRLLHALCLDCPDGARRAGEPVKAQDPPKRGRGCLKGEYRKPRMDFSGYWKERYAGEKEWLTAMLQEHGNCKAIARQVGCSQNTIVKRANEHKLSLIKGIGYVE